MTPLPSGRRARISRNSPSDVFYHRIRFHPCSRHRNPKWRVDCIHRPVRGSGAPKYPRHRPGTRRRLDKPAGMAHRRDTHVLVSQTLHGPSDLSRRAKPPKNSANEQSAVVVNSPVARPSGRRLRLQRNIGPCLLRETFPRDFPSPPPD